MSFVQIYGKINSQPDVQYCGNGTQFRPEIFLLITILKRNSFILPFLYFPLAAAMMMMMVMMMVMMMMMMMVMMMVMMRVMMMVMMMMMIS